MWGRGEKIQGKEEGMGKHGRMVYNSLPLPCGDNCMGEIHCSRTVVPAPSRNTGLGTEMLAHASPWLQEHQGQRYHLMCNLVQRETTGSTTHWSWAHSSRAEMGGQEW